MKRTSTFPLTLTVAALITVLLIGCAVYNAPTREETLQVVRARFRIAVSPSWID